MSSGQSAWACTVLSVKPCLPEKLRARGRKPPAALGARWEALDARAGACGTRRSGCSRSCSNLPRLRFRSWTDERRRFGLWAAYVGGFVLFALLRTVADKTGIAVKAGYVVDADTSMFGGVLPQQWLQERLYDAATVSALDVLRRRVIFSYFVVPHLVALVLWRRDIATFRRYCPALLLTVYVGLAVSAVLPTAPPWAASEFTDSPPPARVW